MSDPVVIRVWKGNDADVFALLPTIPAHGHFVTSYAHVGQHSVADYQHGVRKSRPATDEEAAPLLAELRRIGYDPQPIKRASFSMRKANR